MCLLLLAAIATLLTVTAFIVFAQRTAGLEDDWAALLNDPAN